MQIFLVSKCLFCTFGEHSEVRNFSDMTLRASSSTTYCQSFRTSFKLFQYSKHQCWLYKTHPPLSIQFYIKIHTSVCMQARGCQIGMQGPQLCTKPRHFCKLDLATSRMAFLDLNLHILQLATSNSNN